MYLAHGELLAYHRDPHVSHACVQYCAAQEASVIDMTCKSNHLYHYVHTVVEQWLISREGVKSINQPLSHWSWP